MSSCHVTTRNERQLRICLQNGGTRLSKGRVFFWIFRGFQLRESEKRYLEKTKDVNGEDPYEIPRNTWTNDVDSWPNLTHTRRDVSSKNPHTEDQLMN